MRLIGGQRGLDLSSPVVMGILNITPNSFSDGGCYQNRDAALAQARRMVADGAAIVDIGGESTRPGAAAVSLQEELDRVVPVIEAVNCELDVLVSVDTMKPEVMRAAVAAGAGLINDVFALQAPGAIEAAAATKAAVCLMHMQGTPQTMQENPRYVDVVREVGDFLGQRAAACRTAGISADRILLDPGFGFGKTLSHNLQLLRGLGAVSGQYPMLVGLSRKSMLSKLTGRAVEQRLAGSIAMAALAVAAGARIVRCHDVAETVDAVRVAWAVCRGDQNNI